MQILASLFEGVIQLDQMPPTSLLFGPDLPLDHRFGTFIVRTRWLPDGVRANERHVDAGVRYKCDIDLRVRETAWR